MKQNITKQRYYLQLEQCYAQGLINEKQYHIIYLAMEDDNFRVEYNSRPIAGGFECEWKIYTTGRIE